MNDSINSNHSTNNNDSASYTDFMLTSHLKAPMLSSNSYQDKIQSPQPQTSPIPSPTKQHSQNKISKKSHIKNQFSSNSMLQNKMQQLASINNNDYDKYLPLGHNGQKKDNTSFLNDSSVISGLDNNNSFPLAVDNQQIKGLPQSIQSQLLNNNLAAVAAAYPNLAAYFPPPMHTLTPPNSSSSPKNPLIGNTTPNSALLAASSIYSAYLAAAANTNRTPNVNPYLPYLHAIAQHSLTPNQQQIIQNQNSQNDLFMNAAAALAAATSFGSFANLPSAPLQQKQGSNIFENKKSNLNSKHANDKKTPRSRSRSPILRKSPKMNKNTNDIQDLKFETEFNEKQSLKREFNKSKYKKAAKKAKYEIENELGEQNKLASSKVVSEGPLDLSLRPSNNNDGDNFDNQFDANESFEEEYNEEEEGEVDNNYNYKNSKKFKSSLKTSSSFTVDKILSNNLNFKSKKMINECFINDEENIKIQKSPQLLCSAAASPLSFTSDNYLKADKNYSENNYNCNFCDETFKSLAKLQIHLCEHNTDERLYKCNQCEKSFKRSSRLKSHIIMKKHIANSENLHKSENICMKCKRKFLRKDVVTLT